MAKIALYCRVSTDTQEKAETIENQLRDLQKIYKKEDIYKVYVDNPGSGADPDRPGLNELRKDARRKLFDVVGVWASDRLARDVKLSLILRDEFRELGIQVEVMGRERDDSELGNLFGVIEAAIDELERERIKRRFTSGKYRRLSEGKLIGCYPPYGYIHVKRDREKGIDAHFKINEAEAFVVRRIYELYLQVKSIYLVAIKLREQGIKSRGRGGEPRFMQASTLRKILSNESYIGNHYFGKTSPCIAKYHLRSVRKHKLTGRRKNPKSEWKMVKIPAILDVATFNKAQEILQKRSKYKYTKKTKYNFLSQGLIKCTDCTRRYGGRACKNFLIYRCPQAYNSNLNMPTCRSRAVGAEKLDSIVWLYVSSLINDKKRIIRNVKVLQVQKQAEAASNLKIYDALLLEKNNLKTKKGKLLDLYSEDMIPKDDLALKLREIEEKEKVLASQLLGLEAERQSLEKLNNVGEEIEKLCLLFKDKIKNPSFEVKRYIARKWIEEINIEKDGGIRIKTKLPEGETFDANQAALQFNYPLETLAAQRRQESVTTSTQKPAVRAVFCCVTIY